MYSTDITYIKTQVPYQQWIYGTDHLWTPDEFTKAVHFHGDIQFPDWDKNQVNKDRYLGTGGPDLTGTELENALSSQKSISITQGTQHNHTSTSTNPWHGFILEGIGELWIPQRTFRHSISWQHLFDLGLVYGVKGNRDPVIITANGNIYQIRLLKGVNNHYGVYDTNNYNQSVSTIGSEWNRTLMRLSNTWNDDVEFLQRNEKFTPSFLSDADLNLISDNGQYPIYGSAGNMMGFATDYLCEEGTTIIGRKGNISNPIYIEEKFWNVDTAFGLYPKNGYSTKFINYLCLTIDFKSRNRGTTIPSLVKSDLLTIDIPFISSLSEQKRIVAILDEAFTAIAKAKANVEQNLKNA